MAFTGFTALPSDEAGHQPPVAPEPAALESAEGSASVAAVSSPFVPAGPGASSPAGTGAAASAAITVKKAALNDNYVMPLTYGDLAGKVDLDDALTKVLVAIGVGGATELEDIKCIAEDVWVATLDQMVVDKVFSSALQRARAVRMVRSFLARLGVAPPGLGAPVAAATPP